jgi:hypothetical protein
VNGQLQVEICVKLSFVVSFASIVTLFCYQTRVSVVDICQQFAYLYAKWWLGAMGRRVQLKFHCDIAVAYLGGTEHSCQFSSAAPES